MSSTNISRRGFITSMGALGVAVSGAKLAGAQEQVQEADKTLDYDVVVIGSGIAGMSAALTAKDAGASVLILESMGILGGNSNYAEGMFAVGSSLQKEMGITDIDVESILDLEYDFQNYNVNTKLWELVANNSADNIDWLISKGVVFETVTSTGSNVPLTWHIFEGGHGISAIARLEAAAVEAGIDIMLSTPATALLYDGMCVNGVQATGEDGTVYNINAGSVIIACGGCGCVPEMISSYTNRPGNRLFYRGGAGETGFGINAVAEILGERPKNITACQIGLSIPGADLFAQLSACMSMEGSNMWVNQDGVRFVREDLTNYYTKASNAVQKQKAVFSIASQDCFDHYMNDGCDTGFGMFVLPGTKCTNLPADVETYASSEYFFKADTIAELAQAIGLDAEVLTQTVEAYNALCAAGEDTEYHKDSKFLISLENGPFYAAHILPNLLNTMGGVSISQDCQVINENFEPVENLYCAGMDASGFQGETYGITISGSCQGVAICTGRIAGQKAAENALA
ncbi:MAG: FAD-dependent oxidoreductase [Coriobacteriales bacterium]|nr:FAD-dependent oxidoreductase [Coriobacteriales bacterium]